MPGSSNHDRAADEQSSGDGSATGDPGTAVSATAQLPALDERALSALAEVGGEWSSCVPPHSVWERALPIDPDLEFAEPVRSRTQRFIQVHRPRRRGEPDDLEATDRAVEGDSRASRSLYRPRHLLIGPALRSTALAEERMGRAMALGVLSPDALSSVAYGPEAMLAILVLAGTGELRVSLPIGAVLALLMLSVGLGYRQVIRAYPHGGGSYIVASDNLGRRWGLLAAAGLIVDYILTVAVSVAAGVEAVTSAIPSLYSARVEIGLLVIALLVAGNLRGARDAGAAFAAPTYLFVAAVAVIVIAGLVKAASHGFHPASPTPHPAIEAAGVLLVLRAFASGATAMTGIEVISNSVPVFRPPEGRHARQTLSVMLALLIAMFVAVVLVAHFDGATPGGQETVLSQIAHSSVGSGVAYGFAQAATTLILLVAANSAFNGFPRLLYFMARDGYAPWLFLRLGDRLAFSNGILVLAVPAAVIFAAFDGRTGPLIPLFAVGVFLAFTHAHSGMVVHWWTHRERRWRTALATNLTGATLSAAVVLIAALTKFLQGAWVVVVLVPLIVLFSEKVHGHYERVRQALTPRAESDGRALSSCVGPSPATAAALSERPVEEQDIPAEVQSFAVVPVAVLDLAALHALAYAVSLARPVLAVHVSPTEEEAERFRRQWQAWGDHLPLELVVSPYRATVAPLANYIAALHEQRPELTLALVVPELVVARRWQQLLHNRIAARLRAALIAYEGIVMTTVPFHLPP